MPPSRSNSPTLASLRSRKSSSDEVPQLGFLFEQFESQPEPPAPAPKAEEKSEPAARQLWTVSELVNTVRHQIERSHASISVWGEISNCRPAASGHCYFTLKDRDAQLPVVLFRRQAQLLRFKLEDGLEVLLRGRLSVYESRGQLQLIAETVEPRGAGALQIAFEQLKAKLATEGLFDADRKRELPPFPTTVGIITSLQGAVIRDIRNIVRRRHPGLHLLVYTATMQGPSSPAEVAAGIRHFNAQKNVDLILIARGGGSIEDLSGFNDEALARTIAASELPIVSAIGHETDFTIADFVSDLRAPTPSAAAELITASHHRVEDRVLHAQQRIIRAMRYCILEAHQRLARSGAEVALSTTQDAINRRQQLLDELRFRADSAMASSLRQYESRLQRLTTSVTALHPASNLFIARRKLDALQTQAHHAIRTSITSSNIQLRTVQTRLQTLSPLAVLNRGYALIYTQQGHVLRDARQTQTGEEIVARLASGRIQARVTETSS